MTRDEKIEDLIKQFLKKADKMSQNEPNINKYKIGSELGLSPDQTEDIVSLLKARQLISEQDPRMQVARRSDFEITEEGKKYI